ncbi:hypothetical protein VNI00_014196 [Paramarasmius palmivorus]|uniref:Ig-like domain-containing protein n=1 Tax=Paramarasmius palmivorus TaxID=297713 RepID=A0AAW0BUX5_9AGAR
MVITFYLVLVILAQLWDKASAVQCTSVAMCKRQEDPPTATPPTNAKTSMSISSSDRETIGSFIVAMSIELVSTTQDTIQDTSTTSTNPPTSASPRPPPSPTSPTPEQTDTSISQTSKTSVSSIAAPTQQAAPQITFLLDILTACEPAKLRWTSSNVDNISFNLTIISNDTTDTPHTSSEFPLATGISASKNDYDWSKVTIPQGKYLLNALDEFNTRTLATSPFLVQNGTDISCLATNGTLTAKSIERPSPTSPTNPSSSPSQSNTVTPTKSSINIPVIIGATVGSVLFLVLGLSLGYRYLRRKARGITPKPIDPYPTEYTKSSEHQRSKFRNDEGSECSNDAAPAQNHAQAPEMQARIHRHEDSGWRPPPPASESMGSNLIHMPPEYENAL